MKVTSSELTIVSFEEPVNIDSVIESVKLYFGKNSEVQRVSDASISLHGCFSVVDFQKLFDVKFSFDESGVCSLKTEK